MTDYSELVKFLRGLSPWAFPDASNKRMNDAAAAIEALNRLVDLNTERCEGLREQLRKAQESYERHLNELKAQLPKRGEWVDGDNFEDPFLGKFRCSVCGHAVQAIEYNYEQKTVRFASGKTEYCPNCGAKMEVQE